METGFDDINNVEHMNPKPQGLMTSKELFKKEE